MTTISEFEFDRPTSAAQAIERAASILRSVGVDPHQIGIWLLRQQYGRLISVTDSLDRTRLQVRWLPTVLEQLNPLFSVSF